MRTTINVNDALLRRARELAIREGRSLGDVVDDALRVLFTERAPASAVVSLPRYGGSGLRPGVDLEDKGALARLLDDRDGTPHAAG